MPQPIMRLIDVKKSFGAKNVLNGISVDIYPGEIFGLIGVSGAGKSTLLRSLIGFLRPDSGKILFHGKDVGKNLGLMKMKMGFATQDGCFYERLTVMENLVYFGRMYGLSKKEIVRRAHIILDLVHLSADKNTLVKNLSGGMKRRIDISCALIHDPEVLILDEPTEGLDPILRSSLWKLIHEIGKRGTTIIISSHLLGEVEKMCNRVGILSDGVIIDIGTPDALRQRYAKNEEILLETVPADYEDLVRDLKKNNMPVSAVAHREHKFVIYTPHSEKILRNILEWIESKGERLIEVDVNKPSLSEVFEALMRIKQGAMYSQINELKFSVHAAHRNGYTKEQIRHMLVKTGWDAQTIETVLAELP